jgi:hypothetical protein
MGEYGGLDVESCVLHGHAPTLQFGSLLLPAVNQLQYLIKLLLVNLEKQGKIGDERRRGREGGRWGGRE